MLAYDTSQMWNTFCHKIGLKIQLKIQPVNKK